MDKRALKPTGMGAAEMQVGRDKLVEVHASSWRTTWEQMQFLVGMASGVPGLTGKKLWTSAVAVGSAAASQPLLEPSPLPRARTPPPSGTLFPSGTALPRGTPPPDGASLPAAAPRTQRSPWSRSLSLLSAPLPLWQNWPNTGDKAHHTGAGDGWSDPFFPSHLISNFPRQGAFEAQVLRTIEITNSAGQ